MAQLYYSPISINSGQVPSTQTDFPVLVSQTDNRFKTIANGGHVNNSSGFDIRPYSDSALTTALSYELERYNATTGEVVMWVKVASLSSSTTPIYLGYGDTTLTSDGSSGSATFSNSFISVYHLKDGTTLSMTDSVGAHNGTNHSATAATGKVDGGAAFVAASSQYIDLGAWTGPTNITLSAWCNAATFASAGNYRVAVNRSSGGIDYAFLGVNSSKKLSAIVRIVGTYVVADGTGSTVLVTSTWYHLALHYDGGAVRGFINGVSEMTTGGAGSLDTTSTTGVIGRYNDAATHYWDGSLDEVRISSVARSANWLLTEYNNQSAPGTFETLGSESAVSAGAAAGNWFIFF